jgi:hypothetical protein
MPDLVNASMIYGAGSNRNHDAQPMPRFTPSLALRASVLALTLAGCGGSRTTPVAGVVLLDGKPLADASIQFVPQGSGRDATGQTDKNGQFVMSTFKPRDGVVRGAYKVVISPPAGTADPSQYATAEEAMAAATKMPPKKEPAAATFPQKYTRPDQTPLTQEVPVKGPVRFELQRN